MRLTQTGAPTYSNSMDPFPITNLYEPGMPARMASSPPGASLKQGEWQLLQNVRVGNRALKTRNGMARVGSSPAANPQDVCRGAAQIVLNGVEYLVSVWTTSGLTDALYYYNKTTGAWVEITATSGQYGTTRWTVPGGRPYAFAVVNDPQSEKDYLIVNTIGDPADGFPRVWDGTNCAIHKTITAPSSTALLTVVPTFPKFFDIKNEATNGITNSGANFTATDTGANPDAYFTFARNTTAESNPTVILNFTAGGTSAIDLSDCPQLIMLYESAHLNWWESVKVEINDGGYTTVWDPTDSTYAKDSVTVDASNNRYVVAFSLNQVAAASRNAVSDIRFTWVGKEPAASKSLLLYMVAGSGKVRGECQHAVSYLNSASRAESIGLIYAQDKILTEVVSNLGGPRIDGLRIPNDSKLLYTYSVNYQNVVTAQKDLGVDTLLVYRNDIGEDSGYYTYVASVSLAIYGGGSWSYVSGSTGSVRSYSDVTPTEDKNLSFYAPSPLHEVIPTFGHAMASGSNRLFVGREWNGTTQISELWISGYNHPFRFLRDADYLDTGQIDETSPVMNRVTGENIKAILAVQTDRLDVAGLYLFTDQSMYALTGTTTSSLSQMRRVVQSGTYYPMSVKENRGAVYWVDTKGDIIRYVPGGEPDNLSYGLVEGRMSALQTFAGGVHQISAAFFKERYYVSYDTVGSASPGTLQKTKTLVWDTIAQAFTEDDQASTLSVEFWQTSPKTLYCIGSDKYTYEYEKASQTTDQGTAFTTTLTGRILHDEMWNPIFVKRMGIVCEDGASSTWTTTRTNFKDSTTSGGTINTDVSTTQAYRWDDATPKPGMRAVGVELKWSSSTYPGGKAIFSLPAEVKGTLWKGADIA